MRYDAHHTTEDGGADCAGFFLLVARKAGLMSVDYSCGFTPGEADREKVLAEMLHDNFAVIDPDVARIGDLLRFRFDDSQGRHIALKTSEKPLPFGSMIHAMNGRVTNTGKIFEQRIDGHWRKHLFRAYRLHQWAAH
jgi:cell wall-associated NlpC family hydrolase